MSSIKLYFAICKMFSKCKIFSIENILRNGKHFLLFDCVVKIIPKNYFLHLVLDVKNLFSENVNPSQPPPPRTSTAHHHSHNIQIGKGKKLPPLLCCHHHPHKTHHHPHKIHHPHHTKTTKTPPPQQQNQRSKKIRHKTQLGFGSGQREKVR